MISNSSSKVYLKKTVLVKPNNGYLKKKTQNNKTKKKRNHESIISFFQDCQAMFLKHLKIEEKLQFCNPEKITTGTMNMLYNIYLKSSV